METWIMWALGILSNVITGALAFFIKRNIGANDERQKGYAEQQKANAGELRRKIESMGDDLSVKIDKMGAAMEIRMDKSDERLEKLEDRFNGLVKEIPVNYVDKESWMIQNQNLDRKLDRITELIIQGRAQQDGR